MGDADCAKLVGQVRREVFDLPVPSEVEVQRHSSRLGRVGQMSDLIDIYGEPTDDPKEGDVVLMICAGRPSHVGVFCLVNDQKSVLHAMENAGMVVLHKIADLHKFFLKVEGYYKWK